MHVNSAAAIPLSIALQERYKLLIGVRSVVSIGPALEHGWPPAAEKVKALDCAAYAVPNITWQREGAMPAGDLEPPGGCDGHQWWRAYSDKLPRHQQRGHVAAECMARLSRHDSVQTLRACHEAVECARLVGGGGDQCRRLPIESDNGICSSIPVGTLQLLYSPRQRATTQARMWAGSQFKAESASPNLRNWAPSHVLIAEEPLPIGPHKVGGSRPWRQLCWRIGHFVAAAKVCTDYFVCVSRTYIDVVSPKRCA